MRRLSGLLFILFPVLVQIPFNILAVNFSYPDVLREAPGEILTRFAAGGSGMIATWYVYALTIFVFVAALLVHDRSAERRLASTYIGVFSALIQILALLRWTFLVPFLAADYAAAADPAVQSAIASLFQAQHNYLGVGLGEHIGQLSMVVWTIVFIRESKYHPALNALGYASALCLVAGTVEQLAVVFKFNAGLFEVGALAGFILWSVWLIGVGVVILRSGRR